MSWKSIQLFLSCYMWTDGKADMEKLIGTFLQVLVTNVPKKWQVDGWQLCHCLMVRAIAVDTLFFLLWVQ
jgi:hypothetical protein